MTHQRMILPPASCACLAGCDTPDFSYGGENGKSTLDSNVLDVEADGAPDATIGNTTMHRLSLCVGILALCSLLAACGDHSDDRDITVVNSGGHIRMINSNINGLFHGKLHFSNGDVIIRTDDTPGDAVINGNGDLQIDQHPVAINDAQRALLKSYHDSATMILTDGIATGKAGAALGQEAARSVLTNLASGNPDRIQQDIDAKTRLLKVAALKICTDLSNVKNNQDQLVATLPAFKPYGNVVGSGDANDCKKDRDD